MDPRLTVGMLEIFFLPFDEGATWRWAGIFTSETKEDVILPSMGWERKKKKKKPLQTWKNAALKTSSLTGRTV